MEKEALQILIIGKLRQLKNVCFKAWNTTQDKGHFAMINGQFYKETYMCPL